MGLDFAVSFSVLRILNTCIILHLISTVNELCIVLVVVKVLSPCTIFASSWVV